jgi:SAM-dependent methyltransferase
VSATKFDEHPAKARWLGLLAEHLTTPGLGVLDLGCARGHAARYFCGRHEYVGVDSKEERIDAARELYPEGAFVQANYTRLELPPGMVDAVLAVETFHYVRPDLVEPTVRRIATWLRPGGYLLVYTGRRDAMRFLEGPLMDEIALRPVELDRAGRNGSPPKSLWLLARKAEDAVQPQERQVPLREVVAEAAAASRRNRRTQAEALA